MVIGPAGSGKVEKLIVQELVNYCIILFNIFTMQSTYCSTIVEYCQNVKRSIHVINLDPAAEHFSYPVEAGESASPSNQLICTV